MLEHFVLFTYGSFHFPLFLLNNFIFSWESKWSAGLMNGFIMKGCSIEKKDFQSRAIFLFSFSPISTFAPLFLMRDHKKSKWGKWDENGPPQIHVRLVKAQVYSDPIKPCIGYIVFLCMVWSLTKKEVSFFKSSFLLWNNFYFQVLSQTAFISFFHIQNG